jgi:hypothetical protein
MVSLKFADIVFAVKPPYNIVVLTSNGVGLTTLTPILPFVCGRILGFQ